LIYFPGEDGEDEFTATFDGRECDDFDEMVEWLGVATLWLFVPDYPKMLENNDE
jgi:hypothetical protein